LQLFLQLRILPLQICEHSLVVFLLEVVQLPIQVLLLSNELLVLVAATRGNLSLLVVKHNLTITLVKPKLSMQVAFLVLLPLGLHLLVVLIDLVILSLNEVLNKAVN
jgi:hypothetical protein